eukprot:6060562-Heterocapsa_arctica.AAC.1
MRGNTTKKVKGTKTGAVGRPSILPEQLGHDVKTCGEYEYCLGCGRSTKATRIDTAKHVFWRGDMHPDIKAHTIPGQAT